jgi:hypothetical protein
MRQGNRAAGVGVADWLVGLMLLGCGSTAASGPQAAGGTQAQASAGSGAGTAGDSASSGGAAGGVGGIKAGAGSSSGGAGGLVLGDSKTEACIAYVLAVCTRQDQCSGSSGGNCLWVSNSCPDLAFSPGATRTPAVLKACADVYQKLPCEQIELGILPDCVTPGTVALGEPCAFSSQCASLSCGGDATCGQCVPSAHEGEPCDNGASCLGFLDCTAGKCTRRASGPLPMGPGLGEACSNAAAMYCQPGLRCDALTSTCAAFPMLGMSCADTRSCGGDSYCELDGLICKSSPGAGMPCGVDGFTGGAAYCASPLRCARTSTAVGTCVQLPQAGQPCLVDPETLEPEYLACDAAARCDTSQSPSRCASKAVKGQACAAKADCAAGTDCICPTGQSECDAKICAQVQLKGQPCTAPGDVCHPGFSCNAGLCEPRDSQGLFAAACGP